MNAERGISVQEGPKIGRTIASTVVRAEGDVGYWVNTIRLSGRYPDLYETLVFPVPTAVELLQDPERKPHFEGNLVLHETRDIPLVRYNQTNITKVDFALRNHRRAISAARKVLTK